MINYIDCPECGNNKIKNTISMCSSCEISEYYQDKIDNLTDEIFELKETLRLIIQSDVLKQNAFDRGNDDVSIYELINHLLNKKI